MAPRWGGGGGGGCYNHAPVYIIHLTFKWHVLLGLIRIQTVCKSYQPTTLVGNELNNFKLKQKPLAWVSYKIDMFNMHISRSECIIGNVFYIPPWKQLLLELSDQGLLCLLMEIWFNLILH